MLGNDGDLDLSFLDVKHRVRRIALLEDHFVLSIFGDGSAPIHGSEKYHRVKGDFFHLVCHDRFASQRIGVLASSSAGLGCAVMVPLHWALAKLPSSHSPNLWRTFESIRKLQFEAVRHSERAEGCRPSVTQYSIALETASHGRHAVIFTQERHAVSEVRCVDVACGRSWE